MLRPSGCFSGSPTSSTASLRPHSAASFAPCCRGGGTRHNTELAASHHASPGMKLAVYQFNCGVIAAYRAPTFASMMPLHGLHDGQQCNVRPSVQSGSHGLSGGLCELRVRREICRVADSMRRGLCEK